MKRTNTFNLCPEGDELLELADDCSRLWNELNYKRRQTFFDGEMDWSSDKLYHIYKNKIGSATTQQIIRKNNESWKSFFALLRQKKQGKLPNNIKKIRPPSYWKDRKTGERKLIATIRCDSYTVEENTVKLPFGLKVRWKGHNKWKGKQGRLEIKYDKLSKKWYAYQPVEVKPRHQPKSDKYAYVDLGVKYLITAKIEDIKKPIAYSGSPLLSDWWYWNHRIQKHQSELEKVNGKKMSKRMSRLFRKRKRRFRHKVNTIIHRFVEMCWENGVSKIVAGDMKGIRREAKFSRKSNSMIHNFWSHKYVIQRLIEKSEEFGIEVKLISERGTSSMCPVCESDNITRRKRYFRCKNCGHEAHRDVVGAMNIGLVHSGEVDNRRVASPLIVDIQS